MSGPRSAPPDPASGRALAEAFFAAEVPRTRPAAELFGRPRRPLQAVYHGVLAAALGLVIAGLAADAYRLTGELPANLLHWMAPPCLAAGGVGLMTGRRWGWHLALLPLTLAYMTALRWAVERGGGPMATAAGLSLAAALSMYRPALTAWCGLPPQSWRRIAVVWLAVSLFGAAPAL